MVKRYFFSFLVCLLLFTIQVSAAQSAVVTLSSFDYSAVLDAESWEVDSILYPSGMRLPTKYVDILDFIPYDGTELSNDVTEFLLKEYPEAAGVFTYPEYRAAERFVYLCSLLRNHNTSDVALAILSLSDVEGWFNSQSNIVPVDSTRFQNALRVYQDLFTSVAEDSASLTGSPSWAQLSEQMQDSFYLTVGTAVSLADISTGHDATIASGALYSQFWAGIPAYLDYFGFDLQPIAGAEVQEEPVLPEVSDEPVTGDASTSTRMHSIYSDGKVDSSGKIVREEAKGSSEIVMSDGTRELIPITVDDSLLYSVTTKEYGLRDFITVVALILVLASVGTAWIVHTIRKLRDPLRQWKM